MILAQRYPNTGAFNEHCGFEIEGELNIRILHQSVLIVCSRHIALRSCVVLTSRKAMMEVIPHVDIQVPVADMRTATEESLAKKVTETAQLPFNIEKPPLFRLRFSKFKHTNGFWSWSCTTSSLMVIQASLYLQRRLVHAMKQFLEARLLL